MDWLKDKKNLPIVVGLAVVVLLVAGGLVAAELGLFSGNQTAAAPPPPTLNTGQPRIGPNGPPQGMMGRPGQTMGAHPGGQMIAASVLKAPVAPKLVNPAVGPDPFGIPGGQKRLAMQINGAAVSSNGMKIALRDMLPQLNLFTIHAPAPIQDVAGPATDAGAENYKLIGEENSDGGILAILETAGQSQTVKPGDGLPDGGKVLSIQTTSVTLRTPSGNTVTIPLTAGADQTQNGQDPNAGNFPGQPFGQPGQPFNQPGQPFGQ